MRRRAARTDRLAAAHARDQLVRGVRAHLLVQRREIEEAVDRLADRRIEEHQHALQRDRRHRQRLGGDQQRLAGFVADDPLGLMTRQAERALEQLDEAGAIAPRAPRLRAPGWSRPAARSAASRTRRCRGSRAACAARADSAEKNSSARLSSEPSAAGGWRRAGRRLRPAVVTVRLGRGRVALGRDDRRVAPAEIAHDRVEIRGGERLAMAQDRLGHLDHVAREPPRDRRRRARIAGDLLRDRDAGRRDRPSRSGAAPARYSAALPRPSAPASARRDRSARARSVGRMSTPSRRARPSRPSSLGKIAVTTNLRHAASTR